MTRCTRLLHNGSHLADTLLTLLVDVLRFLRLCLRPGPVLAAENLFLRKQLALYQERHAKPRRATNATRPILVWHRQGFQLFWRWKSRPGRPPIPADLQALIRRMARENPSWGEERIANELLLKLGLRVSPPHGAELHTQTPGAWPRHTCYVPTLADLCAQSCPSHRRL
jgi:putative transposase